MNRSWGGFGVGAVLVVAGALWLLAATDVVDLSAPAVLAIVLIIVGLAVALVPRGGGRGALLTLGIIVALLAFAASLVDPRLLDGGIGDRRETPQSVSDLEEYELAIGELIVDLRELDESARVEASIGIGQLVVIVDENATLEVDAQVAAGQVDIRGDQEGGVGVDVDRSYDGGEPRFELELDGGMGQIVVREFFRSN